MFFVFLINNVYLSWDCAFLENASPMYADELTGDQLSHSWLRVAHYEWLIELNLYKLCVRWSQLSVVTESLELYSHHQRRLTVYWVYSFKLIHTCSSFTWYSIWRTRVCVWRMTLLAWWTPAWTVTWAECQSHTVAMKELINSPDVWNGGAFFFSSELLTDWESVGLCVRVDTECVNDLCDMNACVSCVYQMELLTVNCIGGWTGGGRGGGRERRHWNDVTQSSSCLPLIK